MSTAISVRLHHMSPQKASRQRQHDMRTKPPTYCDPSRAHLNSVIIEPVSVAEARAVCESRRAQRGCKRAMRSNAAVLTSGVITFGKEAQRHVEALGRDVQNAMFRSVADAIAKALNTDVAGLVVHRDETAIHAHFMLYSVDKMGNALSKSITKSVASKLQDVAAGAAVEFVPTITRGKEKAARIAAGEPPSKYVNRSVRQLHEDLPGEIAEMQAVLERMRAEEQKFVKALLEKAQQMDNCEHKLAALDKEIKRKMEMAETLMQRGSIPKLCEPESVEIKTGFMKSETAKIYRYDKIKSWINAVLDWIKREINAEFEYARREIERKRDDLSEKERVLNNKQSILNDKEKNLREWESALVHREETVQRILKKDSPSMGYNV